MAADQSTNLSSQHVNVPRNNHRSERGLNWNYRMDIDDYRARDSQAANKPTTNAHAADCG